MAYIAAGIVIASLGMNIEAYIFGGFMAIIGLMVIGMKGKKA